MIMYGMNRVDKIRWIGLDWIGEQGNGRGMRHFPIRYGMNDITKGESRGGTASVA